MKRFKAAVFGKQGCDKCDLLKRRLAKILQDPAYSGFEMEYFDMGTMEGLIRFSQCEVLNPQRIPSLFIYRMVEHNKGEIRLTPVEYSKKMRALADQDEEINTFLALETDYRSSGVITPDNIRDVLDTAMAVTTTGAVK